MVRGFSHEGFMTSQTYTLMAVHAHPDDESSSTGGLLRLAAEQGHTTVLVICTNVVVTYDANGGYGHPDHIMAHRMTVASIEAAAVAERVPEGGAPWQVRKVYDIVWPRSSVRRAIKMMRVLDFFGLHTPLRES